MPRKRPIQETSELELPQKAPKPPSSFDAMLEDMSGDVPVPPRAKKRARKQSKSTEPQVTAAELEQKLEGLIPGANISFAINEFLHSLRDIGKTRKPGELPDDISRLAGFSDIAYKKTIGAKNKQLGRVVDTEFDPEWRIDKELSSKYQTVFVNDRRKHVVTAYRGTDPKDPGDLASDALVAFGTEAFGKRVKKSIRTFGDIYDTYGKYRHTLTGHSLGGSVAKAVYGAHRDKVYETHTFNPGSSVRSARTGLRKEDDVVEPDKHLHEHYIKGDPISRLGRNQTAGTVHTYVPLKGSKNVHSIRQFV